MTATQQHALLICLYIHRAGAVRLIDVSKNLNLDMKNIKDVIRPLIAKQLVSKSLLKGYALTKDPTVKEVFDALEQPDAGIDAWSMYASHETEKRILGYFMIYREKTLRYTISGLIKSLVAEENRIFNSIKSMEN